MFNAELVDAMEAYPTDPFMEGMEAYDTGNSVCPYDDGTRDAELWWDGWDTAQDLDGQCDKLSY